MNKIKVINIWKFNKKTDQSQINRVVWKACDTFRGVIDPSQYKDYILTMLFLKYVSDVYKAKYSEYLNRYEGDKERAARSMRHERFLIPETSSFDYLYQHRTADNIGELIDMALADIEDANREKMSSEDGSSIFRNISFNSANLGEPKEKNARLKNLLVDFSELELDESHLEIMISLEMLICIWSLHLLVSQGRKRESSLLRQKFQLVV